MVLLRVARRHRNRQHVAVWHATADRFDYDRGDELIAEVTSVEVPPNGDRTRARTSRVWRESGGPLPRRLHKTHASRAWVGLQLVEALPVGRRLSRAGKPCRLLHYHGPVRQPATLFETRRLTSDGGRFSRATDRPASGPKSRCLAETEWVV